MHIVITGASSGIGAGLAKRYATKENTLYLLARRKERLDALKQELEENAAGIELFEVDVTDFVTLQQIAATLATKPLDLVILNAGISTGHDSDVTPFEYAQKVYETNLLSLHAFLEPLIPTLRQKSSSHIVFISSLASLFTMPSSLIYASSKRAMNAYAEGLRYMLHPYNVSVSVIKPGFIVSELTDKNDFKMPFLLPLDKGVDIIYNAIRKKRRSFAFPLRFVLVIRLLNLLPYALRQKIVAVNNFSEQ